jgi:hypothetical protein
MKSINAQSSSGIQIRMVSLLRLSVLSLVFLAGCASTWDIRNPYEQVDWANDERHVAQLHAHSTLSDGRMTPQALVDEYQSLGYTILSITDHHRVTYPWTEFSQKSPRGRYVRLQQRRLAEGEITEADLVYENRDPDELGMIAVPGNEISHHNHMNSFFSRWEYQEGDPVDEDHTLRAVAEEGGLLIWNHPLRERERLKIEQLTDDVPGWFVEYYLEHDHLIGQELMSGRDRRLWDTTLVRLMPDRPVWGFANDDLHGITAIDRYHNKFILPELSKEWVRRGMVEGRFYFVVKRQGVQSPPPPTIESIVVNRTRGFIQIRASNYHSIRWISGGEVLAEGERFELRAHPGINYVRAEIHGEGDTHIGTQPFGIRRPRQQ